MPRVLDEKATKIARARQQRVIDALDAVFGFDVDFVDAVRRSRHARFSAAERRRRRARNKSARAARRRNRS